MSTTVLVLLYAYRTVTVVLRLVDYVRVILFIEYSPSQVNSYYRVQMPQSCTLTFILVLF